MKLFCGEKGKKYLTENVFLSKKTKEHLEAFGITKGAELLVLESKNKGAMIIKVRGTRLALGRDFLLGINVGEIEE